MRAESLMIAAPAACFSAETILYDSFDLKMDREHFKGRLYKTVMNTEQQA